MQAGLMKGTMLSNMTSAYGVEGLTSLYWNFLPFLLKGIPYDVAELFSYSQLTEHQLQIPAFKHCPEAFRDGAIGTPACPCTIHSMNNLHILNACSIPHVLDQQSVKCICITVSVLKYFPSFPTLKPQCSKTIADLSKLAKDRVTIAAPVSYVYAHSKRSRSYHSFACYK